MLRESWSGLPAVIRDLPAAFRRLLAAARAVAPGTAGRLDDAAVREVQELVAASGALARVGEEARALVLTALAELEQAELDGVRPALSDLARSTVDRVA